MPRYHAQIEYLNHAIISLLATDVDDAYKILKDSLPPLDGLVIKEVTEVTEEDQALLDLDSPSSNLN